MVYDPCGCRVSGDFENTRAHDGEACPVRRGNHLVLRPDAEPVVPGFPARSGELGTLYVPTRSCLLRDSLQDLALYDSEGALLLAPGMPEGTYEIERWVVGARWRKVKLDYVAPELAAV